MNAPTASPSILTLAADQIRAERRKQALRELLTDSTPAELLAATHYVLLEESARLVAKGDVGGAKALSRRCAELRRVQLTQAICEALGPTLGAGWADAVAEQFLEVLAPGMRRDQIYRLARACVYYVAQPPGGLCVPLTEDERAICCQAVVRAWECCS